MSCKFFFMFFFFFFFINKMRIICFFFFFKQKTAYEMRTRLEFRRVLFRSSVMQFELPRTRTLPDGCAAASPCRATATLNRERSAIHRSWVNGGGYADLSVMKST